MGRPGRDEQAAHDRQDLREGIFARAKTDLDRTRWSRDWPWSRKRCRPRGPRTSSGKSSGKRSAGNPPAPFDEAGTGDVAMGAGLRPKAKGLDKPPDPTVRAPVLDPTDERGVETEHRPPRHSSTLLWAMNHRPVLCTSHPSGRWPGG